MKYAGVLIAWLAMASAGSVTISSELSMATTAVSPSIFSTVMTLSITDGPLPSPTEHGPHQPAVSPNAPKNTSHTLMTFCSGRDMPDDNFDSINGAIKFMAQYCQDHQDPIPGQTSLHFFYGNAQIYFCNYYTNNVPKRGDFLCDKESYDVVARDIDIRCGKGGGGWMEYNGNSDYRFTIGRDPYHDGDGNKIAECGWH